MTQKVEISTEMCEAHDRYNTLIEAMEHGTHTGKINSNLFCYFADATNHLINRSGLDLKEKSQMVDYINAIIGFAYCAGQKQNELSKMED